MSRLLSIALLASAISLSAIAQESPVQGQDGKFGGRAPAPRLAKTVEVLSSAPSTCSGSFAGSFPCSEIDLVSRMSISQLGGNNATEMADIWGWTDPETGTEYALVARTDGMSFVSLADPENPVLTGTLPRASGTSTSYWRDVKVYKDHAFIVADQVGSHGVQVFDLGELRTVTNPPETFSANTRYTQVRSAHNIVINEETGFAYSVGGSFGGTTCGGGLHMIDISDPVNPSFAGCFADSNTGRGGTGYTHDAQCVLYRGPDEEHVGKEICFGLNENLLSIADVSDKSNPAVITSAGYPASSYVHQGWLSEDQRFLYVGDELDETDNKVSKMRTIVWDVTDLDDPVVATEYLHSKKSIDHNMYTRDNLLYQGNYKNGVDIFDISDPVNPRPFGNFDTTPSASGTGFEGVWSTYPYFESGLIIATSIFEGLFVLRSTATRTPVAIRTALAGAHDGSSMAAGMTDVLSLSHPFSGEPFSYLGSQSVEPGFFQENPEIVDWVMVTLRTTPDGEDIDRTVGFVKSDGTVVGLDGQRDVDFAVPDGDYYVVVRHQNHLAVRSPVVVTVAAE